MSEVYFSDDAKQDLVEILESSIDRFGIGAAKRYKLLIQLAQDQISRNPNPLFALKFPSVSPSIRGLPLWLVTQPDRTLRVKNPPHVIYYRIVTDQTVEILRILHKSMNPKIFINEVSNP